MDTDLFTEGAIYWYENKTNTKKDYKDDSINHDFLVSRPVYILKSNKSCFDEFTINVIAITSSSRRIGIPINIDGIRDGKILPYNIRSVHKEYLTRYMGHVSDDMKEYVNNSILYHLGFSDEKPQYLIEYENIQEKLKTYVNDLNIREKSVYDFIEKRCLQKPSYYAKSTELFQIYRRYYSDVGYSRLQDFNNTISKLRDIYPDISINIENKEKIFLGISLNGNVHKNESVEMVGDKVSHKKKVYSDTDIITFTEMSYEEIIDTLDDESKKSYFSLDIIQKIDNYCRNIDHMVLQNVSDKDYPAIKALINIEINEKKEKVFKILSNKVNPLNLNTINQYIVFISSNEEILKYTDPKYLKKGGISKLRKTLKNNVKHYFVKKNYK